MLVPALCAFLLSGGAYTFDGDDDEDRHGFTLVMRERLRILDVHYQLETRAEWDARMQLARRCDRGRCHPWLLRTYLMERLFENRFVLWRGLTREERAFVLGGAGCA